MSTWAYHVFSPRHQTTTLVFVSDHGFQTVRFEFNRFNVLYGVFIRVEDTDDFYCVHADVEHSQSFTSIPVEVCAKIRETIMAVKSRSVEVIDLSEYRLLEIKSFGERRLYNLFNTIALNIGIVVAEPETT